MPQVEVWRPARKPITNAMRYPSSGTSLSLDRLLLNALDQAQIRARFLKRERRIAILLQRSEKIAEHPFEPARIREPRCDAHPQRLALREDERAVRFERDRPLAPIDPRHADALHRRRDFPGVVERSDGALAILEADQHAAIDALAIARPITVRALHRQPDVAHEVDPVDAAFEQR